MKLFGLTITRTKQLPQSLASVPGSWRGGWYPLVRESYPGAWQQNVEVSRQDMLTYSTVFACLTLIAGDVAKLWLRLLEQDPDRIWTETENPAYSPVLRAPCRYMTRVKFYEHWMLCKLIHGNCYTLLSRDARGVVDEMFILDPARVKPLVAPDGSVFYQISSDTLAGVEENGLVVPSSEIIHDMMYPFFHPLVGVSPLFACGLSATQGLKIQNNSTQLFGKGSQLSGLLSFPGMLTEEAMQKFAAYWEANYAGEHNVGKVAIVSGGMKFEPMTMTATDAQVVEQLRMTQLDVAAAFHVPPYLLGIGGPPPYTDLQSLNLQYYQQALQNPIENLEELLDRALGLPNRLGVQFDIRALARMDTKTQMDFNVAGVGAGIFSPNNARADFDLPPVKGGDMPYMQVQNYSLEALSKRDQANPPPGSPSLTPAGPTAPTAQPKSLDAVKAAVRRKVLEQGWAA